MTTLDDITLETTIPGHTRHRVWVHPELKSHSLLVLTFDRLHLTPLAGVPKTGLISAIEAGDNLDNLLGPLAVVVNLIAVRHLKLDLLRNSLIVEYVNGGLGTSQFTVVFDTPEAADACFTQLWRRLGDGYQFQPYKRDAWALARGPLSLLAGALVATALLAFALSAFEDTASARAAARLSVSDGAKITAKSRLELLCGRIDWRAVCATGGIAAGASQVWLYRRLTRPPASLEVMQS